MRLAYWRLWLAEQCIRFALWVMPDDLPAEVPPVPRKGYWPTETDQRAAAVVEHYNLALLVVGNQVCVAPSQQRGTC